MNQIVNQIMQKISKAKHTNYLTLGQNHSKQKSKNPHRKKTLFDLQEKLSVKTSLQHRLKHTEDFNLKPFGRGQKILTKSAQDLDQFHHKNLFKNTEIKKSIELHKNQLTKQKKKEYYDIQSMTNEQKQHRDAYYGNTTTSHTRSNKKSSRSKLSQLTKKSKKSLRQKSKSNKIHTEVSNKRHRSPAKLSLKAKKQMSERKKQQRRLRKLEQEYIKMLQDKLELKQAEYNTIKTRNLLEEVKGMGGLADGLNEEEIKRLKKIHRTEEDIYEQEISEIKRQIVSVIENQKNEVFRFGGNYYQCEDVMSWIEGKD